MNSDVTVRGVITREYVGVSESDTVLDTVQLMREEQASSVLVLRGDEPRGIMTEYDVLGLVADESDPAETPVSEAMSTPVRSVDPDTRLVDAAGMMSGESIRNLLVEEEATGEVLGVLTDRDIIAAVASLQRTETRPEGVNGEPAGPPPSESNPGAGLAGGAEARRAEADGAGNAPGPTAYATQGVCETCGTLTDELWEINGQLVCADCREI